MVNWSDMKTNTETRLDILGWMYELYSNNEDYAYYDVIESNRTDFDRVYDIWIDNDPTKEKTINHLFDKVLSDLGLNDYGDDEWFYIAWKLRE
jgi:hypothetical protein